MSINIRKLAAVDMVWLGPRVIIVEYSIGVILPLVLGLASIGFGLGGPAHMGWEAILGVWLVAIAVNYVPLLVYAILLSADNAFKSVGRTEPGHARRYGILQLVILVPLLVPILAITQELERPKAK